MAKANAKGGDGENGREAMNFEGFAIIKKQPTKTRNMFGPLGEIAGKTLAVLERNESGDCLCLFTGNEGESLVEVSACDVEWFVSTPKPELFPPDLWQAIVDLAGKMERTGEKRKDQ
jgi:hypothetical protein